MLWITKGYISRLASRHRRKLLDLVKLEDDPLGPLESPFSLTRTTSLFLTLERPYFLTCVPLKTLLKSRTNTDFRRLLTVKMEIEARKLTKLTHERERLTKLTHIQICFFGAYVIETFVPCHIHIWALRIQISVQRYIFIWQFIISIRAFL